MEPGGGGGGEVATKRPKQSSDASAGSEDHLSGHLPTAAAARTSVLSHRWRRIWALLPELRFPSSLDPHQIGLALQLHKAALQHLSVLTRYAGPDSVAAWLPVAARCLSGSLFFENLEWQRSAQESNEEDAAQRGAFELPCLERATKVSLHLGFLDLAVPLAGVFARLTELYLSRFRLHGPGLLGDAVSSLQCPCLQKLTVIDLRGLENLAIKSDSLRQVESDLHGLRQLTIVAPVLEDLHYALLLPQSNSACCQHISPSAVNP